MKILLLSFYFKPDLCAGSFRNTALVEALEKQLGPDDSIDVVTTMPNRYHTFKEEAQENEKVGNIHITRIPLPEHKSGFMDQIWSFRAYQRATWKYLKSVDTSEYDIVVASSSRLFTAFLGARVANKIKKPLYLDIRDIFTETIDNVIDNKIVRYSLLPLIYKIEHYTIKSAAHLNIVSGGFKKYFREYYNGPITEFTNGIDEVFLENDFVSQSQNEKPVITYAGNIGEGQGLEKIVPEAAAKLSDRFIFQIIGDGGTKNKLTEEIQNRDLQNVKLVDPVNREELLKYYRDSDYLFLHLNDYEAFEKVLPSKIFEYAATKKPMIAGVGGFSGQFIENNIEDAILFSPCNADELVRKLEGHQINSNDRAEFIEKYRRDSIMSEMARSIISYVE